jgi:hypothetical protein
MNNFTERTWLGPVMQEALEKIGKTYIQYPPRKMQSDGYTGPITISNYERFTHIREQLQKEGVKITLLPG